MANVLDDLSTRINQAAQAGISDIDQYLQIQQNNADPGIVNDPNAPNANRTALDIALGLFNTPPPIAGATGAANPPPPVGQSVPPGAIAASSLNLKTLLIPALAVAGIYFFMRK